MVQKKTDLSLFQIKEQMEKKSAIKKGIRTARDIKKDETEIQRFRRKYPMLENKELAKIFLTTEEEVERLAHELKIYKDPSYTRTVIADVGGTGKKKNSDGSATSPGYLVTQLSKVVTEEERANLQNLYESGAEPEELLHDLAMAVTARVGRGMAIEVKNNELYRVVNESVDSLHNILKTLYNMKNGELHRMEIKGLDQLITQSKEKNEGS